MEQGVGGTEVGVLQGQGPDAGAIALLTEANRETMEWDGKFR